MCRFYKHLYITHKIGHSRPHEYSRPLFAQMQEADVLINTQQDAISYRLVYLPHSHVYVQDLIVLY